MATLEIRKKSLKTWLHVPSDADNFILSKFYCKTDAGTFKIVEESGSNRREYSYTDITVYDDTDMGTPETFASAQALMLRLEALKYTGFNRDGDIPTSYIESVVAGTNVTIDNTDPLNPIISSTGGGGSQDLQGVTDNGNTTTNDIILINDANAIFGTGGGVVLDNGSKLKEGTIDAGYGGSKGVAQICAVGYELKWEAGRLYVMGDGGVTIREVSHNFTTTPTVYDDITKGFVIGSRWLLDDGTLYICTDATDDTAVWELQTAVTSVGLTMPSAFSVSNSPITSSGNIAVSGAGVASQYVRGDGTLANFPSSSGGGASVSYYLNGSVSQGTLGGVAYKEMDGTPVIGTGTDFNINADGYIAQFITDSGNPNKLLIPSGNWNFETYFSASSSGGSPQFYIELYKYNGTTFTLISSNSTQPENITGGTSIDLYLTTLAVPPTVLLATDRLAVRFYVLHSGRTITMHTQDSHLGQLITTFSTGLTALNGLTSQVQSFATGTSGTDFAISSATDTHTFNLPTASATNRGALSSTDWSAFDNKLSKNTAITGATKTKITYDANGLVTAGTDLAASDLPSGIDAAKIDGGNVSNTEFSYLDGVTSSIQTQIDTKAPIAPRVQTVTSSATVTPTSTNDLVTITAQAVGLTIANPTGTMTEGQALMIRIKDNGTARTIAYGTNYRALGITLPTTTVISKTLYLGCIWNATDTKFDVVGLNQEA